MITARKLAEFYHAYDPIHEGDNMEQSTALMQHLLDRNRIIAQLEGDEIIGFVESWRINFEQLGKTICYPGYAKDFKDWDINNGNICYLSNVVIHPKWRFKEVYKYLKNEFFIQNYACEFFIGQAYRKRHQPLKVFTRQEFYDKYANREVVHG